MAIPNLETLWHEPSLYYLDDKFRVHLFYQEEVTLYELIHSSSSEGPAAAFRNEPIEVRIRLKYEIAFQLSKIMVTLHNLGSIRFHGHLTSHNVFVSFKKIASRQFMIRLKISDLETLDLMEYGNMFFNYRPVSVWSAPEALVALKKLP
mmetsp:Transcript_40291/g.61482  ORF Transcript_40291/g.61482 Transcript_40291/m.61482 type:complete len:149 (-) Transcript_40291:500-946(-)